MRALLVILAAWPLSGSRAEAAQVTGPEKGAPTGPAADDAFERALAKHPYFSRLALERVEREPYLFLFQKAASASPQRSANIVNQLAPVLDSTLEVFEQDVARPNALEPHGDHRRFPVIVLATKGDLENYQRVARAAWHRGVWALYDPALRAAVLYEDTFGQERPWLERARAARHVFLHACQQAWYAGPGAPELGGWILEGMADALSSTTADPRTIRPDPDALRALVTAAQDERASFAYLRTLEELFLVSQPERLGPFYRERTPAALAPLDTSDAWWAFYRQSGLFFGFLWSDANARRPALVSFLGAALHGLGTAAEFQKCFQPLAAAELEQGFLDWAAREHQKAFPTEKLELARIHGALTRGATPPEPAPPALDLADATPEERLALALARWSRGDERAAGAALEALSGEALEPALKERVERERRRFTRWCELRDAHLAALAAGAGSLAFRIDGKAYKAKVLGFSGGELVLEKNRSGREHLPVAELDALELAQEMPRGAADDWVRLLPYVLREDARAKKLLKDDGGEASALLRDASDDYPARLRLGRTLARIEALARPVEANTPPEAEQQLAELRALRGEAGELEVVQRKTAALRSRARAVLERKYALLGDVSLLAGRMEVLPEGRVRITYGLRDAHELADFEASLYPVMHGKGFPPLSSPDQPFHLDDGALVAVGRATLHSLYDLAAPLTVRYGLSFVGENQGTNNHFAVGLADDRAEHFLWGLDFKVLQRLEEKGFEQVDQSADGTFFMNAVYAMELRHDGRTATLRCEQQEVSLAAGGRQKGALFLHAHCNDPVRITDLSIEGSLMPSSFARLREQAVERELAGF